MDRYPPKPGSLLFLENYSIYRDVLLYFSSMCYRSPNYFSSMHIHAVIIIITITIKIKDGSHSQVGQTMCTSKKSLDSGLRILISVFYDLNRNIIRKPGQESLLGEMCFFAFRKKVDTDFVGEKRPLLAIKKHKG